MSDMVADVLLSGSSPQLWPTSIFIDEQPAADQHLYLLGDLLVVQGLGGDASGLPQPWHQRPGEAGDVSAHCAPSLHAPVAAAVPNLRHVEWFVDHARLEPLLVEGAPPVHGGALHPDPDPPGHGMQLSTKANPYQTH